MGAETSKLAVQERFNELNQRPEIGKEDEIWESMLSAASSNADLTDGEFFSMVTVDEIRRICENQPENFKMLMSKVLEKLEGLTRIRMVGTNGTVVPQISNCCRILTRLAPIMYECEHSTPPAEILYRMVDVFRSLLHFRGFTVPLNPTPSVIWSEGIGCPVADRDSSKYNHNRVEVLRALLSVLSSPLYKDDETALEYFTTTSKDPAILCSLLNTSLQDRDTELDKLSRCLLLISLSKLAQQRNLFRWYAARIHKSQDIDWLLRKMHDQHIYTADKIMSIALIWEFVQANSEFAKAGTGLVELADLLATELTELDLVNHPDLTQTMRIRCFALLSMTATNQWCSESIGSKILATVLKYREQLQKPSIELASLIDILWNCSPSLRLTDSEASEFMATVEELKSRQSSSSSTVYMVMLAIHRVMKPLNPALDLPEPTASTEDPAGPSKTETPQWNPIHFQWDEVRFKWYRGVLWGHTYHTDLPIWGRTRVKLFKIAETKKMQRTMELVNRAAASFISR